MTIQERVFVSASLKRAEQALAVHAEQLTSELGQCAADLSALFTRLDEVCGVAVCACVHDCVYSCLASELGQCAVNLPALFTRLGEVCVVEGGLCVVCLWGGARQTRGMVWHEGAGGLILTERC